MTSVKKRYLAVIAFALLLGVGGVVLQSQDQSDPFEVSKQNCIDKKWMGVLCFTSSEGDGMFQMQTLLDQQETTIEEIRFLNNWGKEVTLKTWVPVGSTFAIVKKK
jgi:hypothetical protein